MDYQTIMQGITAGLTKDSKTNIVYLQEECEKYKNHEMSKEILRGIGRLIYNILPDDSREEFNQAIQNDLLGIEAVMEEAQFNIYKKKYDKALKMLEGLVNKFEASTGFFEDDEVSEFHTFSELIQEILYIHFNDPSKDIRRAPEDYGQLYGVYGSLLVEFKRYDDARKALKKSLKWNPTNLDILFEYAETYKVVGDFEEFAKITRECLEIAYNPMALARAYRNLGFYYIEKKKLDVATALFYFSLNYDPESKNAPTELQYIGSLKGELAKRPPLEDIQTIFKNEDIQFCASNEVLGIAFAYGKHSMEEGNKEIAEYFLNIVYELTGDEKVKEMIDTL